MGKRSSRTDAILAAAPRGLPGGQRLVGGLTGDVGRRRPGDAAAASADAVASPAPALLIVEPERGSLVLSADGWMSWSPSAVGRWLSMRWIKLVSRVYARSAFYDPRSLYYKCFVFIYKPTVVPGAQTGRSVTHVQLYHCLFQGVARIS